MGTRTAGWLVSGWTCTRNTLCRIAVRSGDGHRLYEERCPRSLYPFNSRAFQVWNIKPYRHGPYLRWSRMKGPARWSRIIGFRGVLVTTTPPGYALVGRRWSRMTGRGISHKSSGRVVTRGSHASAAVEPRHADTIRDATIPSRLEYIIVANLH